MKEKEYLKFLKKYQDGFSGSEYDEERTERRGLCRALQEYDKDRIIKATEEDLVNMLSGMWAILMWGNREKHILKIISENGLDRLRKKLANLLYGDGPLETRWDDFRSNVKGMGPAIMSELLCKTYPDQYILWNIKAANAYKALDLEVPNYHSLDGASYVKVSRQGKNLIDIAKRSGYFGVEDFLSLDYFFWKELQNVEDTVDTNSPPSKESKKQKEFVHNEVRDLIMEIGEILGFSAKVEVPIAAGAKVDAIWEASIGNMGRVIYVFEVQTSGSIDSLVLNLMKAKNNKAVQGIVAVTDENQIEKIKKEISNLPQIRDEVKFWNYKDVIATYNSLSSAMESINGLGLVPDGMIK